MISDEQLYAALKEYDNALVDALPSGYILYHQFSLKFRWKMHFLCQKIKHPVAYRLVPQVACILLALLTLFGGVVAAHPEIWQKVDGWVKEQFGQFDHYYNSGETLPNYGDQPRYELSWLPEGYTIWQIIEKDNEGVMLYANAEGRLLHLHYCYMGTDGPFLYTPDDIHKVVQMDGYTADLYLCQDPKRNSCIVWVDPETQTLFVISAGATEDGLIRLAQSVVERPTE